MEGVEEVVDDLGFVDCPFEDEESPTPARSLSAIMTIKTESREGQNYFYAKYSPRRRKKRRKANGCGTSSKSLTSSAKRKPTKKALLFLRVVRL